MPTLAEYEATARKKMTEAIGKETDGSVLERRAKIEPASEAWGAAGVLRQSAADSYRSAGNQCNRKRDFTKAGDEFSSAAMQCRFAARDFEKTAKLDFKAAAADAETAKDERKEAQEFLKLAANAHQMAAEDYASAAKALKNAGDNRGAKEKHDKAAKEYEKERKDHLDLSKDYQKDPNMTDAQKNRLVGEESQKASEADDNARTQKRLAR